MKRNESEDIATLSQDDQKEILYNEIRDVQIELKKYCSQKKFELFLINKESRIKDKDIKDFKIELKKYYIQQFFIQISIQKINPRFLYNIDPELINDKEKTSNFTDIVTNSISFKDFVQLSIKIPTSDFFQIYLWTFSVIPSYFNFFLSNDDESYFLFYLEKLKADSINHFKIYSSIIFYHPLFLSFCKKVFDPVFESIFHEDKDQHDPPSKCLQNLEKTIHLCPSIIQKVLIMVPESDRMNYVDQYFYEPLILFPHRFFVLPEYYVLPHRKIQVLSLALENFIIELVNNETPLNLHFHDRNKLLFASFDLEFIKYRMNLSRRRISTGQVGQTNKNQNRQLNEQKMMNLNKNQKQNSEITQINNSKESSTNSNLKNLNQHQNLILEKKQIQSSNPNQSQQMNQIKIKDQIPSTSQQNEKFPSMNQENPPQINQTQTPKFNQNQDQIPSFNENQTQPENKDQFLSSNQNKSQNQMSNIINQNQEQIPSMNQNQIPSLITHQANQNKNQQSNQNQFPSMNQNQIPSLKTQQTNQNQIPSMNQNPDQFPSFNRNLNQNQIPSLKTQQTNQTQFPSMNQTQIQSLNQNQKQNPNFDQNSNSKNLRRFSLAPPKNTAQNPNSSRRLSLTSKNQTANSEQVTNSTNSNQTANSSKKLNSDSIPKSNFNSNNGIGAGGANFNRKRSVSAVSKSNSDLPNNKNQQKNINNAKYFFIEVSKDQDRNDANETLRFEKILNESFFSSTEEVFPLSASFSSSSSSIFLSDWLISSGFSRDEITFFFHNFRKLLQESETLPILDFKNRKNSIDLENKFEFVDILYEFLVKQGGCFSSFIARAACFESVRNYLNRIGGSELRKMIISYKKIALTMKSLIDDKKSFNNYMKKTNFLFNRTFIFYKLIFRLGDTFLYDESIRKTSKEIVEDPYSFYQFYEHRKSIDPVIAKIQYHAFIHNLRFIDFCKAHPELAKYDDLITKFIDFNGESVIHSQPKSAKLFDKLNLIKDRFLFDPIVKNIQHAFEINAVPYEKYEIIRKCFENVEGWLKSIMEYGADDMLPFTIFIFALANPKKFVSNTVFLHLFLLSSIWDIEPNEGPVILTRLKSFIGVTFNSFSELSTFLPIKVFKIEILYILDYSKLSNEENSQESNNNNLYFKKSNYTCLIDSVDEDKTKEPGKPFRTIYQDESPYLGELIFHDCSQSFSMNSNASESQNANTNIAQNSNEGENSSLITNLISYIGQKKNCYDLLIVESDRIDFARKAVSKNKNIQKKIIFCNKNVSDEMKQLDIQCFKILPRFSLCKALKEIMNLFVKIE